MFTASKYGFTKRTKVMGINRNRSQRPINSGLMSQRFAKYWQLYLLLLPAMVYVFIFEYLPMYGVQIAFKDFRSSLGIWGSPWAGFKHFTRFVKYPQFMLLVWNTLSINLYSLAVGFPVPIILALLINEIHAGRFKKIVQMVTYAPHFISTVVICGMIMLFTNKNTGILNHIMSALGLGRTEFLTEPRWFKTVYVLSGVWQNAGWGTIIYLAVLAGVSPELVEAARIDGASRFQVIRHVNIPHLIPTVVILLIMRCGSLLSLGFEKVWLLQNPLNMDSSEIISTYVYKVGLQGAQFSYSSAIGFFNTIINLIFLITVNKISSKVSETSLW
jgi:putative aldouronate transport system permease protein